MKKQSKNPTIEKAKRHDGWLNVLTGIGVKGKDKRLSAEVEWQRMLEVDADNIYAGDDMAAKIVDILPDESCREGFALTGIDKDQAEILMSKAEQIGLVAKFNKAWKMARQYGGAGALLITDDMGNLEAPMRSNAFLKGITPLSMWELYAQFSDMDLSILSTGYFTPKVYTYQPRVSHGSDDAQPMQRIHASRVIRFDGVPLPRRQSIKAMYWGDSVLNRLMTAIRNYQLSHDAASATLQDFRIAIFKIKDLASKIASDDDDAIIKRMELVNMSRSVARAVMIDADGEDFEYKMSTLSGVNELLDKVENKLVAGTNIPRTILLGESPTGMGGSGRHEQENWYDYVANQQEVYFKPKLMQAFKMMAFEAGIDFTNLNIEFNPLWQMDQKETAELRKMTAETDAIYIDRGVVDPEEISMSRFGGDKYSVETEIDKDLRAEPQLTPEAIAAAAAQGTPMPSATGAEDIQKTALNGAQVSSMLEIVQSVATGNLPRESGISIIVKAFNLSPQEAEQIMSTSGKGFVPSGTPLPDSQPGGNSFGQ